MADSGNQPERRLRPAWLASILLVGSIVLLALWLRSGLIGAEQWPIRWLDVEGELQRSSASQVRAAVAAPAGRGYFAVDLDQVRERVEALPWVAGAEVSRHWPDALRIAVEEHRPVARWNEDGLLSDRGEVFHVSGSVGMQGLTQLEGPEAVRERVLTRWLQMRDRLGTIGRDVLALKVDARGAWKVTLDNDLTLLLGREQVMERLERYITIQSGLPGHGGRIIAIDMRYTNGLALRRAAAEPPSEQSMDTGDLQTHG